jgi:hypothetical protein
MCRLTGQNAGQYIAVEKRRSYQNFAHDPIILCFYVDNCLVRFLYDRGQVIVVAPNLWCCSGHTISSSTSPAVKLSPSPFFHDVIPPSVMVGDIAGILNLVIARDADVALSPSIGASSLIVRGEEGRNVHLRGWQRADLNKGEDDMGADGKRSTVRWGRDVPMEAGREPAAQTRLSFRSSRAIARRHECCAVARLYVLSAPWRSTFTSFLRTVSVFISLFVFDNGLTYRLRRAEDVLMVRAPVQHRH